MLQKIEESLEFNDLIIHTLENGALIAGFEIDLFDEELNGALNIQKMLLSLLHQLPIGRYLRLYLKSEFVQGEQTATDFDHSRKKAMADLGFVKNKAVVILEKPVTLDLFSFFKKSIDSESDVLTDFSLLKNNNIKVKPLKENDLITLLPILPDEINHQFQTIDLGSSCLSLVRLVKQSEFGMTLTTLSHIKDTLPLPYLLAVSIERVPGAEAEALLRRKSQQNSLGMDLSENRKFSEAQADLEDISLNGSQLFRFEWQCLVERHSEEALRFDRAEIKRKLEPLGETYIESVGAFQSLKSLYPGEAPHFRLLEKDAALITYLPLTTRGAEQMDRKPTPHSLEIHRMDETLSSVDVFDPRYESYSWCVFGRTGTGKSVLTNALTRALSFNPDVKIIKIDVGGSHTRETQALGGIEKTLSLNEPTGINPFHILAELGPTREAIQILAAFLEVLILEEGETKLTKTMKSDLEKCLQRFSEKGITHPTLASFVATEQELPRRSLFDRWHGKGVYGNAFCGSRVTDEFTKTRLLYFNFSKISQALDPDYAQGGLAAVMAQFNLEMLQKSQNRKKKIVFIADETPFFIKKCFSFFNLSIANVRKEGHGFITVAQKSAHVVIDGDTGILDNSPNKIFFSVDGDTESFCGRNQLSLEAAEIIQSLTRKNGEYSECFFKDNQGERVLRLRLSPEEYWAYTSKDEDKRKYDELREALPSLTLDQVIKCLVHYQSLSY